MQILNICLCKLYFLFISNSRSYSQNIGTLLILCRSGMVGIAHLHKIGPNGLHYVNLRDNPRKTWQCCLQMSGRFLTSCSVVVAFISTHIHPSMQRKNNWCNTCFHPFSEETGCRRRTANDTPANTVFNASQFL